jgi:hypothetical protein
MEAAEFPDFARRRGEPAPESSGGAAASVEQNRMNFAFFSLLV